MTGEERPAVKAKPRVEKNRVLVTGGAGFVGSHLCDYLVNRGDHVSKAGRWVLLLGLGREGAVLGRGAGAGVGEGAAGGSATCACATAWLVAGGRLRTRGCGQGRWSGDADLSLHTGPGVLG